MVDREEKYGQIPNRITDISTFLSLNQTFKELERYINSFGRTLSDNERRLQQTLPGMIKTFDRIEREYKAGGGNLSKSQAADLKVMLANENLILKWLNDLSKFDKKTGLARNERNDRSFIQYASYFEDILQKMITSMSRTYQQMAGYQNTVGRVRNRYGLVPVSPSVTTTTPAVNAAPRIPVRSGPVSALSRPFDFTANMNRVEEEIIDFGVALSDFFQNLNKTFAKVVVVNKVTASLKKMSDSYMGGRALQGSKRIFDAAYSKSESKYNHIQTMQRLQLSVANAGANLRARYPGYNYTANIPSSLANPPRSKQMSQALGKSGAKIGAVASKAIGSALKAMPIIGAITTGVSLIYKQMKKSSPILQAVSNLFELAWNLLWMPLGNALGTLLLPMAEDLINFSIAFNELFADFSMEKLGEVFYTALQFIWGALIDISSALPTMIVDFLIGGLINLFGMLGWDGAASTLETFKNIITEVRDVIRNLPMKLWGYVKGFWQGVLDFFKDPVGKLKGLASGIADAIRGVIGGVRDKVGGFFDAINPFATGGIVTGPTLGLVGEAGPEAIIPLDKANGVGTTYVINIQGDVYGVNDLESRIERVIQRTANKSYYR